MVERHAIGSGELIAINSLNISSVVTLPYNCYKVINKENYVPP